MSSSTAAAPGAAPVRVLLLTNNDSDNVGDQIIEQTVISLVRAVMMNLDIPASGYKISSRAIGMVSRKYLETHNQSQLAPARKAVADADIIIFGGAPVFNYRYQDFYLKTIALIELAQEYGVPVLFSSIGVEPFDASDERSLALQRALALPCVRRATTRDDLASLRAYVPTLTPPASLVSDPAVIANAVFGPGRSTRPPTGAGRVGLVITRSGLFHDNGIKFSAEDQCRMWLSVIAELDAKGYDYRLFTTGHFADEAVLDALVRTGKVPLAKTRIAVNSPEELIDELTACVGVVAFRLHASITAFAYGIPSIGLSWNFKVPYFYETAGYPERALPPERWTADAILPALESAIQEGVAKEEAFTMSVYRTLFEGMKSVLADGQQRTPYTYAELMHHMPPYEGTSPEAYRNKVQRKLRRIYQPYAEKVAKLSLFR